jgi:hypothetical protein
MFAVGVGQLKVDNGDATDEGTVDATATEEGVTEPSAERFHFRLQYG